MNPLDVPLERRLELVKTRLVAVLDSPEGFMEGLQPLLPETRFVETLRGSVPLDAVIIFARRHARLSQRFPKAAARISQESKAGIWVAWPQLGGKGVNIDFEAVRRIGRDAGLVDGRACALEGGWSALRFEMPLRSKFKHAIGRR
ncbi:hypothetical protein IIA16_04740 [bacterium]|nr:hypothetical protein [bacterium]